MKNPDSVPLTIQQTAALCAQIICEVEKAVVGKKMALNLMMAAFLSSGGHILLEDYPGLAKTLVANSFATVLGMDFKRIQFTPDLLPGDITGGYVFDRNQNQFALRKGPIFTHILLADEINRASPKTQSALLEAMQEYQVTLEGETLPLPHPFIVMPRKTRLNTRALSRCRKPSSTVSWSSCRLVIPKRRKRMKSCAAGPTASRM